MLSHGGGDNMSPHGDICVCVCAHVSVIRGLRCKV